jgi:hypothetical protein
LSTANGGSRHEQRSSMLLGAYTFLTTMLAFLLSRRSLSCVGYFAVDSFPCYMPKLVHYAVHLEPFPVGNCPIASRSYEQMSLNLPGLRHAQLAQHLRPRWHRPRRKPGRRQDLGYLIKGGVSTSIPLPSAYVLALPGGAAAAAPEWGALAGPSASPHLPVVGDGNPIAVPCLAR